MFLQFFHNSSSFGASGLAWGRIVAGKIVEELWKYLVNAAPADHERKEGRNWGTLWGFVVMAKNVWCGGFLLRLTAARLAPFNIY
jgi:hypothetical protein